MKSNNSSPTLRVIKKRGYNTLINNDIRSSLIANKNGNNLNENNEKELSNREKAEWIYLFRKALKESIERAKETRKKRRETPYRIL